MLISVNTLKTQKGRHNAIPKSQSKTNYIKPTA